VYLKPQKAPTNFFKKKTTNLGQPKTKKMASKSAINNGGKKKKKQVGN